MPGLSSRGFAIWMAFLLTPICFPWTSLSGAEPATNVAPATLPPAVEGSRSAVDPPANPKKPTPSWLSRLKNGMGLGKSSDKPSDIENVVRNPDGTWRIDPRQASLEEKKQSGFAEAEQLFREEKYLEAARKFKRIAKRNKDTPIEEEALFYQGEAFFKANCYPKAQDAYAALLTKHPTTRFLPQAIQRQYDIAYYWLEDSHLRAQGQAPRHSFLTNAVNVLDPTRPLFDTEGRAVETIENIQQHDPFGPLTDDAVMMAGAYKFTGGNYIQAAGYYDQVVNDQPKSEHAPRAYVLGAQAFWRAYQGPDYDGSELNNSEKLTKAALTRGPDLSAEQRVMLEDHLRVVYVERAKREFAIAELYRRMRKPQAARFYYEKVVRQFADTDWARRAEEEIQKVDELLAHPKPSLTERLAEWARWRPTAAAKDEAQTPETKPEPERKGHLKPPGHIEFERDEDPTLPRAGVDPR